MLFWCKLVNSGLLVVTKESNLPRSFLKQGCGLSISSCYKMTHEYRDPRIQGLVDRNYNDVLSWLLQRCSWGRRRVEIKRTVCCWMKSWCLTSSRQLEKPGGNCCRFFQVFENGITWGCQQVTRCEESARKLKFSLGVTITEHLLSISLSDQLLHSGLTITSLEWFTPLKCYSFHLLFEFW